MKKTYQNTKGASGNAGTPWLERYFLRSSYLSTSLTVLVFIALGFFLYSNTLESPFVFDDTRRILDNSDIRLQELSVDNLLNAAIGENSARSRPIGNISFALNYYFHKYELVGYHIVNIFIHILTGILLWLILKKTLSLESVRADVSHGDWIALFAAMLWLVHPVQTQTVTYIVQRLTGLAAMFSLLSFLFYLKGRLTAKIGYRWAWFSGAVLGWFLALGCKQNAAMLPFFIFLYEWYFFHDLSSKWFKQNFKYMIIIVAVFLLVSFIFLGTKPIERLALINDYANKEFTISERVMTQFRVVVYYISLVFYPHPSRLNLDYDFPLSYSLTNPISTLPALIILIGLIVLGIYLAKNRRLLSFCIFWFFGNLLIESSVIPLALIFEHRLYLPTMLLPLIPVILGYRYIKFVWLRAGLLFLAVAVLSMWTYQRNQVWENDLTLWTDVVKKSPNKARPRVNLGRALADLDRLEEAKPHYLRALELDPNMEEAHYNMGLLLLEQAKITEAVGYYRKALQIKPNYDKAHLNLGVALEKLGKKDEAKQHYRIAFEINPNLLNAINNLAIVLLKEGKSDEAIEYFRKALRIDPNYVLARNNLGAELLKQGKTDEAREQLTAALSLDPNLPDAHYNMGVLARNQGKTVEAADHFRKALELNPKYDKAHNSLGLILIAQGKTNEAVDHFRAALQINPNSVDAHNNLGGELLNQGNIDEAREHFEAALELDPNLAHAHSNMGVVLLQKGKLEAAIFHLREALRLKPDFSLAAENLQRALAIQKDLEERELKIQAALKTDPDNPLLYFEMGNIYFARGEFNKAIAEYEKALSIQARFPEAQYNLALAYAAGEQYDRALDSFKKMLALQPDNPNTYYNIAAMYALQNQVDDSVEWLKKAIAKGYQNWQLIKTDKDLENIRNSAAYKDLVKNR